MAETLCEMAVRMARWRCPLGCADCPVKALWGKRNKCLIQLIAIADNCEGQIEGLRAWATEHPAPRYPTWDEWQESTFPDASDSVKPCSYASLAKLDCSGVCDICRRKPIPSDIAEKLGVKLIEE